MKILIIEDDIDIQRFLQCGFHYKNSIVDIAVNGEEGIKKLMHHAYDVAIVDLLLPLLDGTSVIRKAREAHIKIPIIVLTVVRDLATKKRLLDIGADDFIEKPFSFEELFARISAILRRTQNRIPTEHINIQDLKIIPERRIAVRSGKKIILRPKEYALLEYLMRHNGQVVSRQTLMENVWGYNSCVFSNTVDSHISSLRQKIDRGFDKKLIRTIHGMGYILNESDDQAD